MTPPRVDAPPRREGEDSDPTIVVEGGLAKTNEPVSSAVAGRATTRRHEPHEPPRQRLPAKLFKNHKVHNKRVDVASAAKWFVMFVTRRSMAPMDRWDRGPYAPDQAVLIDGKSTVLHVRHRNLCTNFTTSQAFHHDRARSFSGNECCRSSMVRYACPQTVWTIPACGPFVDGDQRPYKLDAAPSDRRSRKRAFKYTIYLIIAFWTGGAWIIADAPTLVRDLGR